jgi:quercetin dioxygenase-like cupin family protein
MTFARRVVTGIDEGKAVFRSDGAPVRTIDVPGGVGVSELLWLDGAPTSVDDGRDRDDDGYPLEPPPGGASVRIIRLPAPPADAAPAEQWLRVAGDDAAHPGMHATDTLDFMVVLDGRIVLGLDDGEHALEPGDAVVQRGTAHRWRVVGPEPCTYAVVMLRPDLTAPTPTEALHPRAAPDPIPGSPRRLVASVDHEGRSHALLDGPPPVGFRTPGTGGTALWDLWQTGGPLVDIAQGGDGAEGWTLDPLGHGAAFRVVELGAGHEPGEAGWHTTQTIDLDIVLSGQLELSLPDVEPVVLGPGDTVVQRGTHHRWRPVGDQPVRWAAVMLSV